MGAVVRAVPHGSPCARGTGERDGRTLRVAKLNVDENPATAARFGVSSIPTLLLLKAGREIDRILGVQPKSEIARRVERAIA